MVPAIVLLQLVLMAAPVRCHRLLLLLLLLPLVLPRPLPLVQLQLLPLLLVLDRQQSPLIPPALPPLPPLVLVRPLPLEPHLQEQQPALVRVLLLVPLLFSSLSLVVMVPGVQQMRKNAQDCGIRTNGSQKI